MAGGSALCLNGGVCINNTGSCQCSFEYKGTTCSNFAGCNAGGIYTCWNNGTCSNNDSCECLTGYAGNNCHNRNKYLA